MDDELLQSFLAEAREHLETIEADLLAIEEGGADIDEALVNKVFRAAHSIKGGSGFFDLNNLKELAHRAETVLDMIRSRTLPPNPEITNILLAAFDKLREMVNDPSGSEHMDISEHVDSLVALASSFLPQNQKASLKTKAELHAPGALSSVTIPEVDLDRAKRSGQYIYQVEYDLIHDIERQGLSVLELFKDLGATGEIINCSLDFDAVGSLEGPIGNRIPMCLVFATVLEPDIIGTLINVADDRVALLFDPRTPQTETAPPVVAPANPFVSAESAPATSDSEAHPQPTPTPEPKEKKRAAATSEESESASGDSTLRVSVALLDSLMNLAGELVLGRNQLREALTQDASPALSASVQRINLVTSELQEAVMRTRMQPIGNVFGKFPRVVRDMARTLNKELQLDIRGKDVGLDKSLIEGLSDPLTHMVRNAADHGVEMPEERVRSGKNPTGTIRIEARHEAGQVVVEIADDGGGIDPERVAASAVKKGLISQEKVLGMSPQHKMDLLFLPGLSTAEKVTDVSGRGVGMDVVKTNIAQLGGKVEIESEIGRGTCFRIKLPLTLAIIPALIVRTQGERFAIPQINVSELLHVRADQVKERIEIVGDAEVLRLRGQLVPLVRFADVIGMVPTYRDPVTGHEEIDRRDHIADRRSPQSPLLYDDEADAWRIKHHGAMELRQETQDRRQRPESDLRIAVVNTGTVQYGLVMDSFHNAEEIVVKPLGQHLKGIREYAGAAIMGDGRVILILDVAGLAAKADLKPVSGSSRAAEVLQEASRDRLQDVHSLLLFENAPGEICATSLETVLRVERISRDRVEMAGGRRTMQYRGSLIPLVTMADTGGLGPIHESQELVVIISSVGGREVGLLAAMPVDVVTARATIDQVTHRRKGVAGSAIVRDKIVLMADLEELLESAYPEWSVQKNTTSSSESDRGLVLLAEDSDFFRGRVTHFLEQEGYTVLAAPDGEAAWESLQANSEKVCAVVTDIEMPRLTGLGLAQRIRLEPRFAALPIIALTSLAGDEDVERGKAAGITDYQVKLDRDRLMSALHDLLQT